MAQPSPQLIQPHMLAKPAGLTHYFDIEHRLPVLPPFVKLILLLQIAAFIWSGYTYTMNPNDNLLIEGQFQGYWLDTWQGALRLISCTFLHAGAMHLIGNMLLFYIAGIVLEHVYGTAVIAIAYVFCLLTQAFASYMFYDDKTATVGASGVVFGMVGFLIVFYFRYRKEIFVRHRSVGIVFAGLSLHSVGLGLTSPLINNAAHLGGLVGGMVFALFATPFFIERARPELSPSTKRLIVVTSLILALGPFFILQRNLSSHANISFFANYENLIDFLLGPGGVRSPDVTYWRLIKKTPRMENAEKKSEKPPKPVDKSTNKIQKSDHGDSKDSQGNVEGKGKELSAQEAHDKGVKEQGEICKRCERDSAEPCECKAGCHWTYFHHFEDSECQIKLKTTIWGPNTGSPFLKGFNDRDCIEAGGRYFRWDEAHEDCFAPSE